MDIKDMGLLKDIQRRRAKQKQKIPFKRDVFNQISSLVRQYGLKESFLKVLDKIEECPSDENLKLVRVRLKIPLEGALFSLATRDEYAVSMSIIAKINNSYLKFAYSPEEILLCKPLYGLNPSIAPEKLRRYHFGTLFLHERAKIEKMNLTGISQEKTNDDTR
jgi:hypothetical protein